MYQVWADFCSNEGFHLCPQGFTGQDCTIECKTIKICDPITGCKKKFYWCAAFTSLEPGPGFRGYYLCLFISTWLFPHCVLCGTVDPTISYTCVPELKHIIELTNLIRICPHSPPDHLEQGRWDGKWHAPTAEQGKKMALDDSQSFWDLIFPWAHTWDSEVRFASACVCDSALLLSDARCLERCR
jgi:hypothetical protein